MENSEIISRQTFTGALHEFLPGVAVWQQTEPLSRRLRIDGLLVTAPTDTRVMDIQIVLLT